MNRSMPPALMALVVLGVVSGVIHPLLGIVLAAGIYAIEAARKRAAVAKVIASHGSVDALKADIEARTAQLHELYHQHNVPQEDWRH